MTRSAAQAGFTLIELLVSLALLGLMITLIGMALPLAMTSAARTSALSDQIGTVQATHHLLRRQIGEMPAFVTQDGYDRRVIFSGKPGAMRFVANPMAAQGGGGPRMIDLHIAQTGRGARLVYSSGDEKRDLVADAQRISFSYYGPHARGSDPAWHEDWKNAAHLPSLVRIQVQSKAGKLPWPDLVIAVWAGPPPP
jgi:general secretion pathway protein J